MSRIFVHQNTNFDMRLNSLIPVNQDIRYFELVMQVLGNSGNVFRYECVSFDLYLIRKHALSHRKALRVPNPLDVHFTIY